jgi:hypothetical protein
LSTLYLFLNLNIFHILLQNYKGLPDAYERDITSVRSLNLTENYPCILASKCLFRISVKLSVSITGIFYGFSQFVQERFNILPRLGHERLLLNPFQYIFHESSFQSALYELSYRS